MHCNHEQLEGMINKQDVYRTNKVLLKTTVELYIRDCANYMSEDAA